MMPVAPLLEEVFIKNKKLHIRLNSSTLRQELSYKKSEIVKDLNAAVGKDVINDIVLK